MQNDDYFWRSKYSTECEVNKDTQLTPVKLL